VDKVVVFARPHQQSKYQQCAFITAIGALCDDVAQTSRHGVSARYLETTHFEKLIITNQTAEFEVNRVLPMDLSDWLFLR